MESPSVPEKVPLLPPVIVMSSAEKPKTGSEKLNEKERSLVAVPLVSSVMTRLGFRLSLPVIEIVMV